MNISYLDIQDTLIKADIEGLIAAGAPSDEYSHEASDINASIVALGNAQLTETSLISIISRIWAKCFGLSADDINKQTSAFQNVAAKIFKAI